MEVKKPIIIVGTGRCGSTLLYEMFARHPDVTFISNINVRKPKMKLSWRLNTLFNKFLLKRGIVLPDEAYPLFNRYFPGYGRSFRTLKEFDVTETARKNFINIFQKALKYGKKKRIVYKCTGWSRMRFFKEIFPDCLFIHIIRDGRAVANSFLNMTWWEGWRGPENWRWGPLPEKYQKEWEEHDKSFLTLAGIEWKMILDEVEDSKKHINENDFLQIKYEDLLDDPIKIFEKILDFCEMDFPKRFKKGLLKFQLKNYNYKWKENWNEKEKLSLNAVLKEYLEKYGYSID